MLTFDKYVIKNKEEYDYLGMLYVPSKTLEHIVGQVFEKKFAFLPVYVSDLNRKIYGDFYWKRYLITRKYLFISVETKQVYLGNIYSLDKVKNNDTE